MTKCIECGHDANVNCIIINQAPQELDRIRPNRCFIFLFIFFFKFVNDLIPGRGRVVAFLVTVPAVRFK